MNRRFLAAAALALLAATAGCTALFGPGEVDRERLAADRTYEWNTSADVTITVGSDRYEVVYRIEDRSSIALHRFHRFDNERPLDPIAPRFRYPNGTIVGPEAMGFDKRRSKTVVTLPADEGTFAHAAPKQGKRVRVPTLIDGGTYEVILPANARVKYPLLGRVIPGGYDRTVDERGRVHLRWEGPRGDRIVVRYYLMRDLQLLGGLLVLCGVVLLGGVLYFWLQLRSLRERREEVDLDVETGDDT